jgi:glycerate 2-kinase
VKVLIAIDSFKGSLTSVDAAQAIALGIKEVYSNADIATFPLADGGEGTVEALVRATNGEFVHKEVTGPLGQQVDAVYGIFGQGTAVIEVAAACGLPLVPPERRNPLVTTTFGVGELIADAIERGCRDFVIGLGGSATTDAGVGMLQALGIRFLDDNGEDIGFGGVELKRIRKIEADCLHPALLECTFKVACDVNNPLYGPLGAAYVFAPQKGANAEGVKVLEQGLTSFAHVVYRDQGKDLQTIPGAGAAGGLGAAFAGFLNATLQSGIGLVIDILGLEQRIREVNLVITGEGKLDEQTSMGKAPLGIAQLAGKYGIPVIALAGELTREVSSLNANGLTSCFSIVNAPMSLEEAMDKGVAYDNLRLTTNQLFRLIRAVRS